MDEEIQTRPLTKPDQPGARFGSAFLVLSGLKIALPIAVLVLSMGIFGYLQATKPIPAKIKKAEKIWPVQAQKVLFQTVSPNLKLFGQTVSSRQVEMRALVAGEVKTVGPALQEGGEVGKGELLVEIDPFNYKIALAEAKASLREAELRLEEITASIALEKSALKFAKNQLQLAATDYERARQLVSRGTLSKKLADGRELILSQRKETVNRAENNLKVLEVRQQQQRATIDRVKEGIKQTERRLSETRLKAPFDAYVMNVRAQKGRIISVNDPVALLIGKKSIDVRFNLSDSQYGRILQQSGTLIDRKVEVFWKVGDTPIRYKAKVVRVGAQISAQSGGVDIYAAIQNPLIPVAIRAGAFVEVHIHDRTYENVIRLPQTALYDNDKVYVIVEGRLFAKPVQLVRASGDDILLRGEFTGDELVMTSRLSLVGNGVKVKLREAGTSQQNLDATGNIRGPAPVKGSLLNQQKRSHLPRFNKALGQNKVQDQDRDGT